MLTFDSVIVILVLLFIIVSLYDEIIGPAFTFVVAVMALGLFGVLTPEEILAGFANEQVMVLIILLLVGDVIRKNGILDGLFERILRGTRSQKGFLIKTMLPVGLISGLLNNTPLVAILIPYVRNWAQRHHISASKLLIPLSYTAILGGCITLIGTSTNLVLNGMVADQTIIPGFDTLGMFDFAWVGVPMMILGALYLFLFSNKLLPDRQSYELRVKRDERDYVVEAKIKAGSKLVGLRIPESGLLELKGLSLMEVRRVEKVEMVEKGNLNTSTSSTPQQWVQRIASTNRRETLAEGDLLLFTGDTSSVSELLDAYEGIELIEVGQFMKKEQTEVMEVVVSHNSTLVTKTVQGCMFRRRFDAVVLGVHRNGEKLTIKTSDIKLKPGDVLLLLAGPGFQARAEETQDFYPLSKIRQITKPSLTESLILIGGLLAVVVLSVTGMVRLFMGLGIYFMVILLAKIAKPKEVVRNIDYNLGMIIVMALALGTAMVKTGLADKMALGVIDVMQPLGLIGVMAGLYFITGLLAAFLTTKAAAVLIFPIALSTAANLNVDPVPFVLLVANASAATFFTPHGYQTNLMVLGPGGYTFKDYLRIGLPLTLLYMIVSIAILYWVFLRP